MAVAVEKHLPGRFCEAVIFIVRGAGQAVAGNAPAIFVVLCSDNAAAKRNGPPGKRSPIKSFGSNGDIY